MINLGVLYACYLNQQSVSYSDEAKAVFSLMTGLSTEEKTKIAGFVDSQVASGNWAKIDCWLWHGLSSEANSLINWKGGGNASKILDPAHDADSGFSCNGDNTIDTGFDITTSDLYTQNSALFGAFIKTKRSSDAANAYLVGMSAGTGQFISQIGGDVQVRINSGTTLSNGGTEGFKDNSFYLCERDDSANEKLHVKTVGENIVSISGASVSSALGTSRTFRYCVNPSGSFKLDADMMAFVAGAGTIDIDNLLENYETHLAA